MNVKNTIQFSVIIAREVRQQESEAVKDLLKKREMSYHDQSNHYHQEDEARRPDGHLERRHVSALRLRL